MPLLPTILTTALGLALMLLPHHRRPLTRDRALLSTLRSLPRDIATSPHSRRSTPILLAIAAGCLAPLAPAILTLLLALTPPPGAITTPPAAIPTSHARLILALAAPALFLLAALCTLVIYFSGLVIAFGATNRSRWTLSADFTVWYLFATALTAALAAALPDRVAEAYRFALP